MRLHIVFSVAFFRCVVRVAGSQAIVPPTESGRLDLLVCCHKCFQIKPPCVSSSVNPTNIPRSPTMEELREQNAALTAQLNLNEPLLQRLVVIEERLDRPQAAADNRNERTNRGKAGENGRDVPRGVLFVAHVLL